MLGGGGCGTYELPCEARSVVSEAEDVSSDCASCYDSTYADASRSVHVAGVTGGSTSCGCALLWTGAYDYVRVG